jgi:adenosylcobyric acid synthase
MALNSAVTPDGGEIGRAQALQAAACGIPPHTDMNPILLKPNSDTGSQVIVQGRPVGNMTVTGYHAFKPEAFARVRESFERLAASFEVVVMEGAGSIAEINLKEHDIVNLRAAAMARAPVLLVADIDRGGVFAAIVGTLELLEPAERESVIGVVINRFRGDPALLRPGIAAIEARTGVPVLGVVPWLDLRLPEEDSVALGRKGTGPRPGALRIGVVRLPRIANYTDFDPLEREPEVELAYLADPQEVAGCDLLILPGTKSTISDLEFLRASGFVRAIHDYHVAGGRVIGICGGFQMLGRRIADPDLIESERPEAEGLGLLDVETVLAPFKQTHQAEGVLLPAAEAAGLAGPEKVCGYEIHMGETVLGPLARPLLQLTRRSGRGASLEDGAVSPDGRVWGSYLHGLFDDEPTRRALLEGLRGTRLASSPPSSRTLSLDAELDRLADHLEKHLDLAALFARLVPPGSPA